MLHRMAVIQKLLLNKVARQMLLVTHLVTTLATLGNHDLTPRIRQNGVLYVTQTQSDGLLEEPASTGADQ